MSGEIFSAEQTREMRKAVQIVLARYGAAGVRVSDERECEIGRAVLRVAAHGGGSEALAAKAWSRLTGLPAE